MSKKKIMFDTCVIINFSKLKLLDKFFTLFKDGELIILESVSAELKTKDGSDLPDIHRFLNALSIKPYNKTTFQTNALSQTDNKILSYCSENKNCLILSDDKLLRKIAAHENFSTLGSLGLLLLMVSKKILTKRGARAACDELIDTGRFRISVSVYSEFLHILEKE